MGSCGFGYLPRSCDSLDTNPQSEYLTRPDNYDNRVARTKGLTLAANQVATGTDQLFNGELAQLVEHRRGVNRPPSCGLLIKGEGS